MMKRELLFTPEAERNLDSLRRDPSKAKVFKQVSKALALLETNLRHPSLNTHQFHSLSGPKGEEVFETYAQQHTPGAYRIFFYYRPDRRQGNRRIPGLTIIAITPHP